MNECCLAASDPECQLNHNVTNDTVVVSGELHMWCTVEFRGNWRPLMEWRTDRGVALTTSTTTIHRTNQSTRVVTFTLQLRARLNGTRIQCVTKFVEGSQELLTRNGTMAPATNAPDHLHIWTSPAIYFSREFNITNV